MKIDINTHTKILLAYIDRLPIEAVKRILALHIESIYISQNFGLSSIIEHDYKMHAEVSDILNNMLEHDKNNINKILQELLK